MYMHFVYNEQVSPYRSAYVYRHSIYTSCRTKLTCISNFPQIKDCAMDFVNWNEFSRLDNCPLSYFYEKDTYFGNIFNHKTCMFHVYVSGNKQN